MLIQLTCLFTAVLPKVIYIQTNMYIPESCPLTVIIDLSPGPSPQPSVVFSSSPPIYDAVGKIIK